MKGQTRLNSLSCGRLGSMGPNLECCGSTQLSVRPGLTGRTVRGRQARQAAPAENGVKPPYSVRLWAHTYRAVEVRSGHTLSGP
jgi:hypothetical protein